MRVFLHDAKPDKNGYGLILEIRYRQASWMKTVWVPWKWLAVDNVVDRVQAERERQHRPFEDPGRPALPLESYE